HPGCAGRFWVRQSAGAGGLVRGWGVGGGGGGGGGEGVRAPWTRIFWGASPKRPTMISWLARVEERNATQRGPGSAHPLPAHPVLYGKLQMFRRLQHADAPRERDEETLSQLGHFTQHLLEVLPIDHEHAQRRRCPHGHSPRPAIEQAHLAEEIAGTQERPLLAGLLHRRRAVDDHEELVPGLTGTRERGSRGHFHHPRDVGERAELSLGAV